MEGCTVTEEIKPIRAGQIFRIKSQVYVVTKLNYSCNSTVYIGGTIKTPRMDYSIQVLDQYGQAFKFTLYNFLEAELVAEYPNFLEALKSEEFKAAFEEARNKGK